MPPLILLPGLACDAELFRDQHPALAALGPARVSNVHTREATLPAMAARLLAEHPGPLALAGASMGGMLALHAWRQAPDRVRGLALLGTTARADTPAQIRLRSEGIAAFEAGRMDEILTANLVFAFHASNAARLAADYGAMIRRAGVAQLVAQNRAVMAREDLRPDLADIACPLLVMGGDSDGLTPPECAREIAAAVPQAQLEILADCGHMLTWERPGPVTEALTAWWRSLA
ncbi:MAG: alpha/beta fold hydrolase [Burkholderiaceae bacterium]|nr:alpha/beta fold hydrolase [Burkholderiaceae bacterium]